MPSSPEHVARQALQPSFEELYEDAPCGYLSYLPDGTVIRVNRTLLRALGREACDVLARPLLSLLSPASQIYHATRWGPLLELQDEVHEIPVDLMHANGTRYTTLLTATLTRNPDGSPAVVRASLFDATDRRRYERALIAARDAERVKRELAQRAAEGTPTAEVLRRAAVALRETLATPDVTVSEATGAPAMAPADDPRLIVHVLGSAGDPLGSLIARSPTPFSDADREFAAAIALLVSGVLARRRTEALVRYRATHDRLTGLDNRAAVLEGLAAAIAGLAEGETFAVCHLDVDNFKLLNDARGRGAGDELLRGIAQRLSNGAPAGSLVARLGGDEFLVAGPVGTEPDEIVVRVREALAAPFLLDGAVEHPAPVTLGTAVATAGRIADELIVDADVAMYAAKASGRGGHVRYEPALRERSASRLRTEAELRTALREGQLRVHYQPVVDLCSRRTVSMEALVRWEHPERGLVPPGQFIPIAEESDLIRELGAFVLEEAAGQLARWRARGIAGPRLSVAVNVSARQFVAPGFAASVRDVLARHGLADHPELLGLEVTETMLVEAPGGGDSVFEELSAIGVGLLLDDFGTGVSSLARLRRLPVDTLKIDRAFINALGQSEADEAIVAAMLAMAEKLGLCVVAEGVEDTEQLDRLAAMGCGRVQGFFFSRPLPAAEMAARLAAEAAPAPVPRRMAPAPERTRPRAVPSRPEPRRAPRGTRLVPCLAGDLSD